jgi:hypothetical protein
MLSLVAMISILFAPTDHPVVTQPYPLLVERAALRVYAPGPRQPWGRCPRGTQTIVGRSDLRAAARAVLLAVPPLNARQRPPLDVRGATAHASRLGPMVWTRSGLARSTCGWMIASRTIAVGVRFPRVTWSASMSSATFFVSRVGDGWIIWHQAH